MNEAFLRMTGFTREEALGKTWAERTPPEFHEVSCRAVEEVLTRGESTPYQKQYVRKDGSRWWGLFAARRIGEEGAEFVLDITKRRGAEEREDRAERLPGKEKQEAREKGHASDVRSHLRKNGVLVFIEGVTRPLTGADGTLTGFFKVG